MQFDLNLTHNCFIIDKTKTILTKKNNLHGITVLNRGLKVGSDVPKSINMNIKVPTQKYKNKYCYSR